MEAKLTITDVDKEIPSPTTGNKLNLEEKNISKDIKISENKTMTEQAEFTTFQSKITDLMKVIESLKEENSDLKDLFATFESNEENIHHRFSQKKYKFFPDNESTPKIEENLKTESKLI